jgi:hypothetical protein
VNHLWAVLATTAITLPVAGLGLILTLNYRGFTEWHVRATVRFMPFSSLNDEQFARQVRLERYVIGPSFVVVPLLMIVTMLARFAVQH